MASQVILRTEAHVRWEGAGDLFYVTQELTKMGAREANLWATTKLKFN